MVTGSFLPDLVVSINSLVFLFYIIKNKIYFFFNQFFSKFFLFFYIYLNFSSFLSVDILFSLKSTLPYFRFFILVLIIYYLCENVKDFKKNFFISLLLTLFVLVFDGYIQYIYGTNLQGYGIDGSSRLGGLFGDEKILGSFLSRHLPLLIFFIFNLNLVNSRYKYFFMLFITSIVILIFLSGERASFVFSLLTIIYLILLIKKIRLLGIISLTISLMIIFSQIYFNDSIKNRMIDKTLNGFSSTAYISKIHERYFFTALDLFKENIITGTGPNTFRKTCANSKIINKACSTHPHNTYIQLLSETGIIGFLFIFMFFLYFMFISLKQFYFSIKKKIYLDDDQVCLVSAFLITLLPIASTGNFFNNFLSIIYFLPIGFYLSSKLKNDNF